MHFVVFKEFSKALVECKKMSLKEGGEEFNLKTFVCGRNRMQNKGAMAMSKFIKVILVKLCLNN